MLMRLAILGGGGFRVPLVYGALLRDEHPSRVSDVALYDVDEARLAAIGRVVDQMATGAAGAPRVTATTDLDEALRNVDFVFSAIRVGGLTGRTVDERVALGHGLLGQETTGPGGLAYALRTVPVAVQIARRVEEIAPEAWVINFTNPAGLVTEAMQRVLGDRVIGICDSPTALARRAALALGLDPLDTRADYVGLNHLGWLRGLWHAERDMLPDLLGKAELLETIEEGRLFGVEWLQTLGAIPNEYLYYYYFTREALAAITSADQTRGEFLRDQQRAFYRAVATRPQEALTEWQRVRAERDATYMKEARAAEEQRDAADLEGGGYEGVALAILAAIGRGATAEMILNVRNAGAVAGFPDDAVVEVPCVVDGSGPRPAPLPPVDGHMLGLMQQVKAVERLVIEAVETHSARLAVKAFALHPLVDSVTTARALLDAYRRHSPEIGRIFAD
jgi:6-phospho-beta-glucosidase